MKFLSILIMFFAVVAAQSTFASSQQWEKLTGKWSWMVEEEGQCWWSNMTIYNSGKYRVNSCGKVRTGKMSKVKLHQLNVVMLEVLKLKNKRYACTGDATQDYSWNYSVKSSGKTKKYFFNNGQDQCSRSKTEKEFEALESVVNDI